MRRRDFIGYLISSGLLLGVPAAARADPTGRVLVVVFMRGGWDGLNVAVPYGDDAYHSLRPTIRIAPPSAGNLNSALDLDGFFGLHPSMSAIHALYLQGRVAVLPAVHYSGATRSHFAGQDIVEDASTTPAASGWLARYLASSSGALQRAVSLTAGVPRSLSGNLPVAAYPDLGGLALATSVADQNMLGELMAAEYARAPTPGNPSTELLHNVGIQLLMDIEELQAINGLPVENGAEYPVSTFGRQMRQAAALIKGRVGLELITLDLGSWDTHRGEGGGAATGQMASLLKQFSDGVGAFFHDLGSSASRVTLLTSSEFGRTAAENGSGGTDHGHATTWLAIGGGVNGGVHTGSGWPGLGASQLLEGRYLAHRVDFRDVYAECLARILGVSDPARVIPDHTVQPVGFLA